MLKFKILFFLIALFNSGRLLSRLGINVVNQTTRKISFFLCEKSWCCRYRPISGTYNLSKDKEFCLWPYNVKDKKYNNNLGIVFIIDDGQDEYKKCYYFVSDENYYIYIDVDISRPDINQGDSIYIKFLYKDKLVEKIDL